MNLKDRYRVIRTIFDNLRETDKMICDSNPSPTREMVMEKFEATITMLSDGSVAIKEMIKDDLEKGTE